MGTGDTAHYGLFQKEQLGWMLPQTINTSGTYRIDAYETSGGIKGLKILRSMDPVTGARTWYYLEHRSGVGFDVAFANNANIMNGVIVRTGMDSDNNRSYLLDLTPETTSWYDPALTVGQTFTDPASGVTITTVSADATGALVTISVPSQPSPTPTATASCVRSNPTLTVSQAQGPWVPSGTAVNYNLTIRNNDGGACSASAFNLQAAIPTNWGVVLPYPTQFIAPGSNGVVSVQVTSAVGSADGFYPINVSAANTSVSGSAAATQVSYALVSSLAMTAVPSQTSYTRTQTVTVNATVRASGTVISGAMVVFRMTKPNGAVVTKTATSGSNGVATFSYALSKKSDPTGIYQMRAQGSSNSISGVVTTSFSVR
jgi:hypothetical protein